MRNKNKHINEAIFDTKNGLIKEISLFMNVQRRQNVKQICVKKKSFLYLKLLITLHNSQKIAPF